MMSMRGDNGDDGDGADTDTDVEVKPKRLMMLMRCGWLPMTIRMILLKLMMC